MYNKFISYSNVDWRQKGTQEDVTSYKIQHVYSDPNVDEQITLLPSDKKFVTHTKNWLGH